MFRGAGCILLAFVAIGGIHDRAIADGPCPSSILTFWYAFRGGNTSVEAAALDTTIVPTPYDSARVTFDRTSGRMSLDAVGRMWAGERVVEQFDVVGVAPGTTVSANVFFQLDAEVLNNCGGSGCGAYFTATLAYGADSAVADGSIGGPCSSCTRTVDETLSLPITFVAGTPQDVEFALLYHTTHVAWGRVAAVGSYGVVGLPAGVRAVTCGGADLTPVRRTSWGRLKSAYR
jgi:hypothetical protein